MHLVRYSVAAVGISTLFLGLVVAYAVVGPMPERAADVDAWNTVVTKY